MSRVEVRGGNPISLYYGTSFYEKSVKKRKKTTRRCRQRLPIAVPPN
jgi:hypothetical protein